MYRPWQRFYCHNFDTFLNVRLWALLANSHILKTAHYLNFHLKIHYTCKLSLETGFCGINYHTFSVLPHRFHRPIPSKSESFTRYKDNVGQIAIKHSFFAVGISMKKSHLVLAVVVTQRQWINQVGRSQAGWVENPPLLIVLIELFQFTANPFDTLLTSVVNGCSCCRLPLDWLAESCW